MKRTYEIALPVGPDGAHTAFACTAEHFHKAIVERPEPGLFKITCDSGSIGEICHTAMSVLPDVDAIIVVDLGSGVQDTFKRVHKARRTGDDRR